MITFMVEPWLQFERDAVEIWKEHYEEFRPFHKGSMEMGVAIGDYRALDAQGKLLTYVAREAGFVVGYCVVAVRTHLHYSGTLCGFEDSYFLSKRLRRGLAGYRLLRGALSELRKRGVRRVYFMTKEFNTIERLLLRLGMVKCDSVFTMEL